MLVCGCLYLFGVVVFALIVIVASSCFVLLHDGVLVWFRFTLLGFSGAVCFLVGVLVGVLLE